MDGSKTNFFCAVNGTMIDVEHALRRSSAGTSRCNKQSIAGRLSDSNINGEQRTRSLGLMQAIHNVTRSSITGLFDLRKPGNVVSPCSGGDNRNGSVEMGTNPGVPTTVGHRNPGARMPPFLNQQRWCFDICRSWLGSRNADHIKTPLNFRLEK